MGTNDVFQIDQNYPTSNFLLVPGPNPNLYTVYIFRYSDWIIGNQTVNYSVAQSGVNSDGTWQGVFDPFTNTYSPILLPETEIDGSTIGPYTIIAIQTGLNQTALSTILLALQINAPAVTPTSLIGGAGIIITGDWPDQTVTAINASEGSFTPIPITFLDSPYIASAFELILVDTSSGNVIITLPLSAHNGGKSIIIQKITGDINTIIVNASGSDSINGNPSETILYENSSMLVISDGIATWRIS